MLNIKKGKPENSVKTVGTLKGTCQNSYSIPGIYIYISLMGKHSPSIRWRL